MLHALARAALLACLLSLATSAHFIVNDYLITPKAVLAIDKISNELSKKTNIHEYAIATTKKLKQGTNLYKFISSYESNLSKPYVVLIFAPNAVIKDSMSQTGRVGIIPSSKALKVYDSRKVLDNFGDFIGSIDSNSLQSKYDVAIFQAYSELADELAASKKVTLQSTPKKKYGWIPKILLWIVLLGTVALIWVYLVIPFYRRIRYGKQK